MITIYTHSNNPLKKEFWKHIAKKALRKYSGPDAVLDSFTRGLKELNIPFEVNPFKAKYDTVHVLSGVAVLQEMIHLKEKSGIKKLIVGPTVVTTIHDYDGIIANKNIDILVTPSEWVKDFYISLSPSLRNKMYSWPAGVKIPNETSSYTGKVILFRKNIDEEVFVKVTEVLKKKSIAYTILNYGRFSHSKYIQLLKSSPFIIYLQKSESQGIALQEAWSYNVPTLVYKNTKWISGEYSWQDETIAAPYLKTEAGVFFTLSSFEDIITTFKSTNFAPKKYCEENLSDLKSAERFIEILQNHEKTY